ncbi:hypothetical protein HLK65_15525 [Azospirillum formosense]|nr:hypothetical protein [Azospirillum formosense]
MDAPAFPSVLLAFLADATAAVIHPARHGNAPRVAGLDGQSASRSPITCRGLEARCAQRVSPSSGPPGITITLGSRLATAPAQLLVGRLVFRPYATRGTGLPKVLPYCSSAQTTRAILFATATAATLAGRRLRSLASQVQRRRSAGLVRRCADETASGHPITKLDELLPWAYARQAEPAVA